MLGMPGVNFTNILRGAFSHESVLHTFFAYSLGFVTFWPKEIGAKAARKLLMNLPTGLCKSLSTLEVIFGLTFVSNECDERQVTNCVSFSAKFRRRSASVRWRNIVVTIVLQLYQKSVLHFYSTQKTCVGDFSIEKTVYFKQFFGEREVSAMLFFWMMWCVFEVLTLVSRDKLSTSKTQCNAENARMHTE